MLIDATMSRQNFHHVVAALDARVPGGRLDQALNEYHLERSTEAERINHWRCADLTARLADQQGDPALLARGFQTLEQQRQLFPGLSPVPGDILDRINQYPRYLCLHSELGDYRLRIGAEESSLQLFRRPAFEGYNGQALALLYSTCRLLERGSRLRIRRVTLRVRQGERERRDLEALLGVPVSCGEEQDGLVFDNTHLLQPSATTGSLDTLGQRERYLRRMRPGLGWSDSVRGLLPTVVGLPGKPLALCASLLAVSERTLQRRVEAEGQDFRSLLSDSRRQLALTLMPWRDLTTEQLAARLGYSQTAQFYRAFRDWFGESPGRKRVAMYG
ncbi:AraC family transcriptional regulator [Alcanivorax xiamenensis]|uniref:AraC family transcriptional regulator n=1 Tax=Alcanivorax xiamenensis TaxID=1177156 RepID=A0ABQ6Y322_9GAMM|nr:MULTISPECIES: helix-turn-helix domain-containing protein [Alcanivorax]KAF0802882.1 AraC family transcriptional regulator [Alcanivorax xiamenensis]